MPGMAIVTPIWRQSLKPDEERFVRITERTNPAVDRWFCAPQSLDCAFYDAQFPSWRVSRFPDEVFASVHSYSYWLTGPEFYLAFSDYEFITICQTDAVLVKDVATLDMSGIDYVGAPWEPPVKVLMLGRRIYVASDFETREGLAITRLLGRVLPVGNGGLSTRRVESMIDLTRHISSTYARVIRQTTLEDVLICAVGRKRGLRIADANRAARTFQETQVANASSLPDVFGFHAIRRWNPTLAARLTAGSIDEGQ
jgi:hypothetical protein